MDIIGHGVDSIEIERVRGLLERSDDFLFGWFTEREIKELGVQVSRAEVVAGRVAAKEAVVKALGTGFNHAVSWQDVEIRDGSSGPFVQLSGGALETAYGRGVSKMLLSTTHDRTKAIASVIATGGSSEGHSGK